MKRAGRVVSASAGLFLALIALAVLGLNLIDARSLAGEPPVGALRIASFNLHYITPEGRLHDRWLQRRDAVVAAIRDLDADIVALQEVETFTGENFNDTNLQLDWIRRHLPEYAVAAIGDVRTYPSTQPVLYRPGKVSFKGQGYHFYSDTPDVMYSRTFNGSYDSFTSWVRFQPKGSDRAFVLFNIHFDYSSALNRLKSAELTRERAAGFLAAGEPVLIAGDINAIRWSKTAGILKAIPARFAPINGPTFHFDRGIAVLPAIDHFVYTGGLELIGSPAISNKRYGGVLPADHYPIVGDFALR